MRSEKRWKCDALRTNVISLAMNDVAYPAASVENNGLVAASSLGSAEIRREAVVIFGHLGAYLCVL